MKIIKLYPIYFALALINLDFPLTAFADPHNGSANVVQTDSSEDSTVAARSEPELDVESLRLEKVANSYRRWGFYSHAEEIVRFILDTRRKKLGPDHLEIAGYLSELGWLCAEQGRYLQAETHYIRALAITTKLWGADNLNVADQLDNLAGVYRSQSRFAEAQMLYERAISIWKKSATPNHSDSAAVLANFGANARRSRLV